MRDIVFMEVIGINPVIVHGGGKAISRAMSAAGLEARFVGGPACDGREFGRYRGENAFLK